MSAPLPPARLKALTTAALLDDDSRIVALAVRDLIAAAVKARAAGSSAVDAPAPEAARPNILASAHAVIDAIVAATGERPNWADRHIVSSIAKESGAPRDVVRHLLRHPSSTLGRGRV